MTEQERIDNWRKDFESNFIDGKLDRFEKSGHYVNDFREALWQGFLMAKGTQKPVKLPAPDTHCFDDDTKTDVWSHSSKSIKTMLDIAGITYTVKGE